MIDPDLVAGTKIGDYVVERELGRGGFGVVYKARHPLIGKLVAIKVLAERYSVDPVMAERFVTEARAAIAIGHPNIVDILTFGELGDGRRYLVMEYLDGEALDARLARGPLSLVDALPILGPIAGALDAAHAKGIVHRDLKPENVFLARSGDGTVTPRLLDFGVAKLLHPDDGAKSKTKTGTPIGTAHFMSPEQCHGRDVDHRTDLYAFGVLVYKVLTGVYALDGDDYMTILMRQIADDPAPPSSVVPALGDAVDEVVLWLMAKAPADRPPDLATAIRALEAAARGESPPDRPAHVTASGVTVDALPVIAGPTALSAALPPTTSTTSTTAAATTGSPRGPAKPSETTPPKRSPLIFAIGIALALGLVVLVVQLVRGTNVRTKESGERTTGSADRTKPSETRTKPSKPTKPTDSGSAGSGSAAKPIVIKVPILGGVHLRKTPPSDAGPR